MKKIVLPIILGISVLIAVGITYVVVVNDKSFFGNSPIDNSNNNKTIRDHPDALTSGPLTITQYEHMISDNIFMYVSGIGLEEKGNIRIFMPDGRLYKTLEYDGSLKENFNVYFKPDTSQTRKICEQEELVGIWRVLFDNNAHSPLEFEIINEHRAGPDVRLPKSC